MKDIVMYKFSNCSYILIYQTYGVDLYKCKMYRDKQHRTRIESLEAILLDVLSK